MARETKVGLLVGMGVILLVGIIVSDHLSNVHDQKRANMQDFAPRAVSGLGSVVTPAQPLGENSGNATAQRPQRTLPTPEEMRSEQTTPSQLRPPQPVASDNLPREAFTVVGPRGTIDAPKPEDVVEQPKSVAVAPPTTSAPTAEFTKHTVKSGDTLYQLAKAYYRDPESWKQIADANKAILGPDHALKIGMELTIPKKSVPGSTSVASAGSPPASHSTGGVFTPDNSDSQRQQPATIEVKPGQTLRVIAAKHMGNAEKWKDLLAANKDQLRKAEDLKPGMKLKLPAAQPAAPASSTTARRGGATSNATPTPSSPSSSVARSTPSSADAPAADGSVFGTTPAPAGAATSGSHVSPPVARDQPQPRTSVPWPAASVSTTTTASAGDNTYTVKQGDTLASIAGKSLGDRNRWSEIVALNRQKVSTTGEIQVGTVLNLPPAGNR